jgi:hypothetical protein
MGAGISVASFAEYDENSQTFVSKERLLLKCDNDPCQSIFNQMADPSIYKKMYEEWSKRQEEMANKSISTLSDTNPIE